MQLPELAWSRAFRTSHGAGLSSHSAKGPWSAAVVLPLSTSLLLGLPQRGLSSRAPLQPSKAAVTAAFSSRSGVHGSTGPADAHMSAPARSSGRPSRPTAATIETERWGVGARGGRGQGAPCAWGCWATCQRPTSRTAGDTGQSCRCYRQHSPVIRYGQRSATPPVAPWLLFAFAERLLVTFAEPSPSIDRILLSAGFVGWINCGLSRILSFVVAATFYIPSTQATLTCGAAIHTALVRTNLSRTQLVRRSRHALTQRTQAHTNTQRDQIPSSWLSLHQSPAIWVGVRAHASNTAVHHSPPSLLVL